MQPLVDRKCDNYVKIVAMLGKVEQAAIGPFLFMCEFMAKQRMDDKIYMYDELARILDELVKDAPDLFQRTETGWSVTMIAPEAKNTEDPTKDILRLNKVEDIFWAKDIALRAFLSLFPRRSENGQQC